MLGRKKVRLAYGERPQKRGQNVSIIGAMGFKGIMTQCSLMGGIDAITFEAFISQKLVPLLWKIACVVMDNCSIHKGSRIRSLIEEVGAKLVYLPTYSPDFNPIENCWRGMRRSAGT